MGNTLLALFTCHSYDYQMGGMVVARKHPIVNRRPAIQETWLKDVDIPYKWFFGKPPDERVAAPDEVFLDSPDGYYYNSVKLQSIVLWAIDHGYDRVIKVDDDTYIHWGRFKQRPAFTADYSGGHESRTNKFACGGCYAIAGPMLGIVANAKMPNTWAEDAWVGDLARANGIPFVIDKTIHFAEVNQYRMQVIDPILLTEEHNYSVLNPLTPEQMVQYHKKGHS